MSVLKPKIIGSGFPFQDASQQGLQPPRTRSTTKALGLRHFLRVLSWLWWLMFSQTDPLPNALSLTHLSAKISLERLLLCLAQIIYISCYAGQLFRSLPAPPDAFRHRHGPGERDCDAFVADWPA